MSNMKHARLAALALGACLTITACAGGNDNADTAGAVDTAGGAVASAPVGGAGTGSMESMNESPRSDAEMMTMMTHSNDAEVSSSRLAQTKATNAEVKKFATMMVTEHTKMQKEGQALAKSLAVTPQGTDASADKREMKMDKLDDLQGKSAEDFDKAYMEVQVELHERTLNELRAYETRAQSPELRAQIQKAIPAIQQHLQQAQQLRQQLDNKSGN
jgi:putative membrane protein